MCFLMLADWSRLSNVVHRLSTSQSIRRKDTCKCTPPRESVSFGFSTALHTSRPPSLSHNGASECPTRQSRSGYATVGLKRLGLCMMMTPSQVPQLTAELRVLDVDRKLSFRRHPREGLASVPKPPLAPRPDDDYLNELSGCTVLHLARNFKKC